MKLEVNDRIEDRGPGHHGGRLVALDEPNGLGLVEWDNSFNEKQVLAWAGLHALRRVNGSQDDQDNN